MFLNSHFHKILFLCLLSGVGGQLFAQKRTTGTNLPTGEFLNATTRTGDDAVALLQRYHLYDFSCNIEQFFRLNGLKEDYRLKKNTSYILPVVIVPYNGKSIRSTLQITDWRQAKRIETYNRNALAEALRPDDFLTTRQLWLPWHELHCPDATKAPIPVAEATTAKGKPTRTIVAEIGTGPDKRNFAIFGKKNENTPLLSQKLKGKVFYLISGHGGPDSGAQGKRAGRTLCEDEYAYDVTLRLLKLLLSHGASAYMIVRDPNDGIRDDEILTCDQDEQVWGGLTIPRPQKERLRQRTDLINDLTAQNLLKGATDQTIIEIHVDSRSRDTKTDVFFYYRPDSELSKALALKMHQTFLLKYLKKRGGRGYTGSVTSRHLHTLKETTTPKAVYIELANIRNDWDQQRLVLKNNRQAVANWLCQTLLN